MRLKLGLKQKDVAALLHVSPGMFSKIEGRKQLPNVSQLIALEMIYAKDGQYLLNGLAETLRAQIRDRAQKSYKVLSSQDRSRTALERRKSLERLIRLLQE